MCENRRLLFYLITMALIAADKTEKAYTPRLNPGRWFVFTLIFAEKYFAFGRRWFKISFMCSVTLKTTGGAISSSPNGVYHHHRRPGIDETGAFSPDSIIAISTVLIVVFAIGELMAKISRYRIGDIAHQHDSGTARRASKKCSASRSRHSQAGGHEKMAGW